MKTKFEHPTARQIVLRWASGSKVIKLAKIGNLYGKAAYWNRIITSKKRWMADPEAVRAQSERAIDDLLSFGLTDDALRQFISEGHVEIATLWENDDQGFAERVFPWEFVLLRAAHALVGTSSLVVTRHLKRASGQGSPQWRNRDVLFVESAPGGLAGEYVFDAERDNIQHIFAPNGNGPSGRFRALASPGQTALLSAITDQRPDVIHLSGIDAHEGHWAMMERAKSEGVTIKGTGRPPAMGNVKIQDGFFLRGPFGLAAAVGYQTMGDILCAAPDKPMIVSFNCQNSAARMAAATVAQGAGFAIGIHGTSDENYVENFYFLFYRLVLETPSDVFGAFIRAIRRLGGTQNDLDSTDLVLWSDRSLYADAAAVQITEFPRAQDPEHQLDLPEASDRRDLVIDVKPFAELNYSMLHNGRGLFSAFRLMPRKTVRFSDVEVTVEFQLGPDTYCCRKMLDVEQGRDLRDLISIPLTWGFLGTIQESINTTIYIEVKWDKKPVYRETHRVTVHPVNDWKDNKRDGGWLPCFVLPLDPAVQQIVEHARRNLRIITDDADAKFNGYQSGAPDAVDTQVRAIWSALAHNHDIGYIDPPPAYAEQSQRLRVPSQVLGQGNGTCIDLCLTFAACLEYVGLYPVVFLITGHAFAGYWRNLETFNTLSNDGSTQGDADVDGDDQLSSREGPAQSQKLSTGGPFRAFEYDKSRYGEIVQFINDHDLVPVETTFITQNKGFEMAKQRGLFRLNDDYDFDSMIDIRKARRVKVTPLPIQIKEALS